MVQLNFDTGLKKYEINGNVIEVNPADAGLYSRIKKSREIIDGYAEKYKKAQINSPDTISDMFANMDRLIREQIDFIFAAPVAWKIFGNTNCMTPCPNGKAFYENFLDVLMPVLEKGIEEAYRRSSEHISKYTSQLK